MPKADREELILEFLEEHGLALPRQPLYVNMKREHNITFSNRTLKRLLDELVERGEIEKLDIGNGYYVVTDKGRERISGGGY